MKAGGRKKNVFSAHPHQHTDSAILHQDNTLVVGENLFIPPPSRSMVPTLRVNMVLYRYRNLRFGAVLLATTTTVVCQP